MIIYLLLEKVPQIVDRLNPFFIPHKSREYWIVPVFLKQIWHAHFNPDICPLAMWLTIACFFLFDIEAIFDSRTVASCCRFQPDGCPVVIWRRLWRRTKRRCIGQCRRNRRTFARTSSRFCCRSHSGCTRRLQRGVEMFHKEIVPPPQSSATWRSLRLVVNSMAFGRGNCRLLSEFSQKIRDAKFSRVDLFVNLDGGWCLIHSRRWRRHECILPSCCESNTEQCCNSQESHVDF